MPSARLGRKELALEAGLHTFGRIPKMVQARRVLLSQYLLDLSEALRSLSKNDLAILEALLKHGSISAAAAVLGPDRPGYRTYIQKRFKHFERLTIRIGQKIHFRLHADDEL